MASLLAARIPGAYRKVIISQRKAKAVALADEVGGVAADQWSAVRGCHVVFLAIPGSAMVQVLQEIAPHLDEGALAVNMATDVMTDDLAAQVPKVRLAAAKVIGHAREMALGSPGVIVLDHVSPADEDRLRPLLEGLGAVVGDREAKVMAAAAAVAEAMVKVEAELRKRLEEIGLDRSLVQAAIATTGPGVLRSLSQGDAGPFLQQVIARIRAGETAATIHSP